MPEVGPRCVAGQDLSFLLWAEVPLPLRMRAADATTSMGELNMRLRARYTARLCRAAVRPQHARRECYLQCGQDASAGNTFCPRHQALVSGRAWPPRPPNRPVRTPWDDLDRRRPLIEQLNVPQLNSSDYLEAELCRVLRLIVGRLADSAAREAAAGAQGGETD